MIFMRNHEILGISFVLWAKDFLQELYAKILRDPVCVVDLLDFQGFFAFPRTEAETNDVPVHFLIVTPPNKMITTGCATVKGPGISLLFGSKDCRIGCLWQRRRKSFKPTRL